MQVFRKTRSIGKTSAFGIGNVKVIKGTCISCGFPKVIIIHDELDDYKSHSLIIRLPQEDLILFESLATNAFSDFVPDADIKYV